MSRNILSIDPNRVKKKIVHFIRHKMKGAKRDIAVIGLSGGLDSSCVAHLAVEALGKKKVFGLVLPSMVTCKETIQKINRFSKKLGIRAKRVDIAPMMRAYFKQVKTEDPILIGNRAARERMAVLYDFSFRLNGIVLGTTNKTELSIGYFTKYGDGGVDIEPIADLYKTQVVELSEFLGVPQEIVNRVPTAELWKGQTDEGEIGIPYKVLDQILYYLIDKRYSERDIRARGFSIREIKKVRQLVESSQHKREIPPVARL